MQQIYHVNTKMPSIVISAMAVVCLFVIVPFALVNPIVGLLSGSTMLITLAASAYFSNRTLRSTKLCLDETGLRKISVYGEYFVPWGDVRRLMIKRNRKGGVKSITAIAATGRRIVIVWYEEMDAIAEYIESHARSLAPQDSVEDFLSKPVVRWIAAGILYTGFAFLIFGPKNSAISRMGPVLMGAGLLPTFWQYRQNLFSTVTSKAAWKHWSKRALINLAVAIGIMLLGAVILYVDIRIL